MRLDVGEGFGSGSDDEAWAINEFEEVLEAVGVEKEVVGDWYICDFDLKT